LVTALKREQVAVSIRFSLPLAALAGCHLPAEFLLTLATECDGGCSVALPYSKALMAGQSGMNPETLSRAFAKLRERGMHTDVTGAHRGRRPCARSGGLQSYARGQGAC